MGGTTGLTIILVIAFTTAVPVFLINLVLYRIRALWVHRIRIKLNWSLAAVGIAAVTSVLMTTLELQQGLIGLVRSMEPAGLEEIIAVAAFAVTVARYARGSVFRFIGSYAIGPALVVAVLLRLDKAPAAGSWLEWGAASLALVAAISLVGMIGHTTAAAVPAGR